MFKLFLCLTVLIFSTVTGKNFTDKYSKKLKFYTCLKNFNLSLKQNIKFRRKNIIDLLNYNSNDEDFNCFLSSCKLAVTVGEVKNIFLPKWATEEDRNFFVSYFEGIGKNGTLSELDYINSYSEIIDDKLIKIKENATNFSKLGQKLGFAVGACLVVIII